MSLPESVNPSVETTMASAAAGRFRIDELGRRWSWFVGLGVVTLIFGAIIITYSIVATLAMVIVLGVLMLAAGVLEAALAFLVKNWEGFFLSLLMGLLYAVGGLVLVANPAASAAAFTLVIALMLIFGGVFRILVASADRFPNWTWLLMHGVLSVLLGVLIWSKWPASGLWVIGLFIGIDMIVNGWTLIMLGMAAKKVHQSAVEIQNRLS
ncbi:HdeD family acid-resistance protein [Rubinisphaera margarita]|uniref:HdeD family acid-resistance protein n=1 Tax=Rubinisphaera margarita TaxID=2909586 RepID=UPI001EE78984|nr:HdeD family acid-resistance protein [Rubinisphaera margarita]MCG6156624.1 HdeD family acid-resistance protein [Rubinisphaera margarita]